jgi:hypothetical protein
MHPSTAKLVLDAHVRDLQRAMHPERKRSWRRLAWIREIREGH